MHRAVFVLFLACFSLTTTAFDLEKGRAALDSGDYTAALRELRPAAEVGDREAQFLIGSMFLGGLGVDADPVEAAGWLHRAVRDGLPTEEDPPPAVTQARSLLGVLYMQGIGVKQDVAESIGWLELAAAAGDVDAQQNRGALAVAIQDYATALEFFGQAAEQGNVEAQKNLGAMHQFGWGTEVDLERALALYRGAADKGNTDAMAAIGNMYENGSGVPEDARQAFRWYFAAADRGHPGAQQRLARRYFTGSGVKQSNFEAYRWLLLSSADGDPNTVKELAKVATLLTPEMAERARASAEEWRPFEGSLEESLALADATEAAEPAPLRSGPSLQEAAEAGVASAQVQLGNRYERGEGVERDLAAALDWYRKAAAQGHFEAQVRLGKYFELGAGVEQDDAEAVRWYRRSAKKGFPPAQFELGTMLAEGRGAEQDPVEADVWLGLAAEHGMDDAARARSRLREAMTAKQIEESSRRILEFREWEEKETWPAPETLQGLDPAQPDGVTPPRKIGGPRPEYPELARVARIQARIVLEAVIGIDGGARNISMQECWTTDSSGLSQWGQLQRQDPPGVICSMFEESASKAVRDWRFEPAVKEGEPVEVNFTVKVDFRVN